MKVLRHYFPEKSRYFNRKCAFKVEKWKFSFVVHREPPAVTRAFHCAYQLALREEEQVPKKKDNKHQNSVNPTEKHWRLP
jgi:hypothetical protein